MVVSIYESLVQDAMMMILVNLIVLLFLHSSEVGRYALSITVTKFPVAFICGVLSNNHPCLLVDLRRGVLTIHTNSLHFADLMEKITQRGMAESI